MKLIICILLLLTVAPVCTVTLLALIAPEYFDGLPTGVNILLTGSFGFSIIPVWPIYIPPVVVAPIVMHIISKRKEFYEIQPRDLIIMAFLIGGIAGFFIFLPAWIFSGLLVGFPHAIPWFVASFVSGGITLVLIGMLYRLVGRGMAWEASRDWWSDAPDAMKQKGLE